MFANVIIKKDQGGRFLGQRRNASVGFPQKWFNNKLLIHFVKH